MNAGIIGLGRYIPEKVLTNRDLEKMVETSDEWIRTRTGIEERRIASDDVNTSHMALAAAKKALADADVAAEDIDMILVATVTPDQAFPTVACMIQEQLGAHKDVQWILALHALALCMGLLLENNLSNLALTNMCLSLV